MFVFGGYFSYIVSLLYGDNDRDGLYESTVKTLILTETEKRLQTRKLAALSSEITLNIYIYIIFTFSHLPDALSKAT